MSDSARTEIIGDLRIEVWQPRYQLDDEFWKYHVYYNRRASAPLLEGERIASEGEAWNAATRAVGEWLTRQRTALRGLTNRLQMEACSTPEQREALQRSHASVEEAHRRDAREYGQAGGEG